MAYQMTKADLALLARPALATVALKFRSACSASRLHSEHAAFCLKLYGDHGPLISGCVREHFPEDEKQFLRDLSRLVTTKGDEARAARPKGARMATVNRLARLVATRDGSGFYGPQALT